MWEQMPTITTIVAGYASLDAWRPGRDLLERTDSFATAIIGVAGYETALQKARKRP